MSLPPGLALYRAASGALGALAWAWLDARGALEDAHRRGERFGRAGLERPPGPLVWLHGASVGEMGVALQLHAGLAARRRELSFLVTTGTRTSGELFARRGPDAMHQYAPLDRPDVVRRFLQHWRPALGVFIESELWPNLTLEARAQGVPLALVNARMSPATLRSWGRLPKSAQRLFDTFQIILAGDARTAEGLTRLSGREAPALGNLKLAAAAPDADASELAALKAALGGRPVWLAASTHTGEEEVVLAAHQRLIEEEPDALLIIAPRHPSRGEGVAALAEKTLGEKAPLRSRGEGIGEARIYVADTMGELGLFYRLAPVSLVGGSLRPELRGHNPIEPAKLDCAVLSGPHVESFSDLYEALDQGGGVRWTESAPDIAAAVLAMWREPETRARQIGAARDVAETGEPALTQTLDALIAQLGPTEAEPKPAHAAA